MLARRTGKCPTCKKAIKPGDEILKRRGRWVCAECAAKVVPVVAPSQAQVSKAKGTIDTINGRMLGRGAPVQYDDLGYNKIDHDPGLAWLNGDPWRGKPAGWTKMVDRLRKYRRQITSMNLWDTYLAAADVLGRWAEAMDQAQYEAGSSASAAHGATTSTQGLSEPQGPATAPGGPAQGAAGKGNRKAQGAPRGKKAAASRNGHNKGRKAQSGAGALPEQYKPREGEPGWYLVPFPYDADLLMFIKALPRRRWFKDERAWGFPIESLLQVAHILDRGDATCKAIAERVRGLPGVGEAAEKHSAALSLARAVNAASSGTEGKKVVDQVEACIGSALPPGLALYPFQAVGVGFMHAAGGKAIIADEMGTGKTIEVLAYLLHEYMEERDPFPAVVVVPAVLKLNWQREAEKWLAEIGVKIFVAYSNMPAPDDADIVIINYDIMHRRVQTVEGKEGRRKVRKIKVIAGLPKKPHTVILDEFHRCKNPKAKRTQACLMYAALARNQLLLSGTPLLNRPLELQPALGLLRPDEFGSYWYFAKKYCGAFKHRFGWDMSGATNLDELRNRMKPFTLRRTKDMVLTELPPKRRVQLHLELDNRKVYDQAEADVATWLADGTRSEVLLQSLAEGDSQEAADKKARKAARGKEEAAVRAEHLVRINTLRQLAGKGKVKAAVGWMEDFLATGKKLVVFAHHQDVIRRLSDGVNDVLTKVSGEDELLRYVILTGSTPHEERQVYIDRFQEDPDVRVFICSTMAGGVGITLTAANDVLFLEREWVPGDEEQAEDRCHRIGAKGTSVTCWYTQAPNSIDADFAALVESKRAVFGELMDGRAVRGGMMRGLTRGLLNRQSQGPEMDEDEVDAECKYLDHMYEATGERL